MASLTPISSIGQAENVKVDVTEFNDLLGAADDTVQKALESLDDHTHEIHYFADSFALLNGSVEAGTGEIERTFYEDQIYLQINEVSGDGCGVRLNFTLPPGITGVRVHVIGRYKGSPTHWMNAFAYDWDGAENDEISSETNRFNDSNDDAHFYFNLSAEHTDSDGGVQIDFEHNAGSYNNNHDFYIDHVAILYAGEGDASKIRGVAVDDSDKADGVPLAYDDATNTIKYRKELKLDAIQFDTSATQEMAEGLMRWNDNDGTLNLGMPGGEAVLQMGQEMYIPGRVKNETGATLTNGTVVYINGVSGGKATIAKADASTEALSMATIGVVTEDIAHNGVGHVTIFGLVRGTEDQPVDTSGMAAGNVLWLSEDIGEFTTTKPASPAHAVVIGYVRVVSATVGEIIVHVTNGFEIYELHDVDDALIAPADGAMLYWDDTAKLWKGAAIIDGGDAT